MADKRKIEIFSAGCAICQEAIEAVRRAACSSCEVIVHDMKDMQVARRAKDMGIRSVPAAVIDGKLASCCADRGVDIGVLKSAGLGRAL
ncbi:MAG: thioredoxin family protein [Bradyrhizobium sp.]|uniref:thioredoxin family protein n=1 Tax=Bradyrhizobium sp. TaxID=376 RepID=UPI0023921347|nr:thioredoxin family protein [Bradyrhizobium sp.]MDE2330507.1 thioredoxin family protein [Bradyrhizobium sp.]MDE2603059.1 thioredoxin family protein [Bradyrhizobium sp.]